VLLGGKRAASGPGHPRLPSPLAGSAASGSGPCSIARSRQEREGLRKELKKPRKSQLGRELPTEKAILEDKCNPRI